MLPYVVMRLKVIIITTTFYHPFHVGPAFSQHPWEKWVAHSFLKTLSDWVCGFIDFLSFAVDQSIG